LEPSSWTESKLDQIWNLNQILNTPEPTHQPLLRLPLSRVAALLPCCATACRSSKGVCPLEPHDACTNQSSPLPSATTRLHGSTSSSPFLLRADALPHYHCSHLKLHGNCRYTAPRLQPKPITAARNLREDSPPHQIPGEPPSQPNFEFSPSSTAHHRLPLSPIHHPTARLRPCPCHLAVGGSVRIASAPVSSTMSYNIFQRRFLGEQTDS
jgi:hypothetical protein